MRNGAAIAQLDKALAGRPEHANSFVDDPAPA